MPEDYPEAYRVQNQEEEVKTETGYEAGDPYEGQFDIPEYVQTLRDQINEVREALSAEQGKHFSYIMHSGHHSPSDPIDDIRREQAMDHLYVEERRLMQAIKDAQWILPPMLEPPHNAPLGQEKAKEILRHGEVHGRALTPAQRGLFGVIAGGHRPRIMSKRGA